MKWKIQIKTRQLLFRVKRFEKQRSKNRAMNQGIAFLNDEILHLKVSK